jgi:spore coat protein JB
MIYEESNEVNSAVIAHSHSEQEVLAMAYVPRQKWRKIYRYDSAFLRGTIFAELDKPWVGQKRGCRQMTERSKMLKEVQSLDFAMLEAALFLDINNNDSKALAYFNNYQKLAADAKAKFENKYGPLTHRTSKDMDSWRWVENPWPWEYAEGGV